MTETNDQNERSSEPFGPVACVERVRNDDQKAAVQLIEYLHPQVRMIVRANLPRRRSEEPDIIQQILIRVFQKLPTYAGKVPLQNWVARVACNHCINVLRAQSVRPEWRMADLSPEEARLVQEARDPHQGLSPSDAMAARDLLDRLFGQLKPQERLVIELIEVQDRSVQEVAELTGWSQMTVRVRAFRARQRLNKLYQELKRKESR
jgi:RNA polymerase sigma factor (sigma-70 family)